jgi:hypothetical protein
MVFDAGLLWLKSYVLSLCYFGVYITLPHYMATNLFLVNSPIIHNIQKYMLYAHVIYRINPLLIVAFYFLSHRVFTIIAMMKSNSLRKSNRHLRSSKNTRELLVRSIASSTAIETGESIRDIEVKLNRQHSVVNRVKLA